MKIKTIFIFCGVLSLLFFFSGAAFGGALVADLENALMCKCDDKCGKVIINCTCDTANQTRKDFQQHLDSGMTVEQIIKMHVDKYGETVLSAPSKNGFNLTAWITPFAAILGGGFGIRKLMKRWVKRKKTSAGEAPDSIEEPSPTAPSKYARRLQDELDNLES